jgi:hypothetical protein
MVAPAFSEMATLQFCWDAQPRSPCDSKTDTSKSDLAPQATSRVEEFPTNNIFLSKSSRSVPALLGFLERAIPRIFRINLRRAICALGKSSFGGGAGLESKNKKDRSPAQRAEQSASDSNLHC